MRTQKYIKDLIELFMLGNNANNPPRNILSVRRNLIISSQFMSSLRKSLIISPLNILAHNYKLSNCNPCLK